MTNTIPLDTAAALQNIYGNVNNVILPDVTQQTGSRLWIICNIIPNICLPWSKTREVSIPAGADEGPLHPMYDRR